MHYFGNDFKEGMVVNPKKVGSIMDFKTHRNMDEVRSFMLLAGYYRRFIKNSHALSTLLHNFIRMVRILNGYRSVEPFLNS